MIPMNYGFLSLVIRLFFVLVAFFFSGYITFKAFCHSASKDFSSSFESFFICIVLSMIITSLASMLLALIGFFSIFNILVIQIVYISIIFGMYFRKFKLPRFSNFVIDKNLFCCLGILALYAFLMNFFPLFENYTSSIDPGIYVNTGVNIAKTGAILVKDPWLEKMDSNTLKMFTWKEVELFIGYHLLRNNLFDNRLIVPGLMHLHPVWIAIFYCLFGLSDCLLVMPFFGLMSCICVFMFGKSLYNRGVGVIAAFLLAINYSQIYFSRSPFGEILFQFLIFGALYLFSLAENNKSPFFSSFSAFMMGLIFFEKIDGYLLIIPLILVLAYWNLRGVLESYHKYLANFSAVMIFCSYLYIRFIAYQYVYAAVYRDWFPKEIKSLLDYNLFLIFITIVCALLILIIANSNLRFKCAPKYTVFGNYRNFLVAFFFIAYFIYQWVLRPMNPTSIQQYNFVRLVWFITPIGALLGLLGLLFSTYKKRLLGSTFDLFLLTFLTFFFTYVQKNPNIHMDTLNWVRRYLPIVFPSFAIFVGYGVCILGNYLNGRLVSSGYIVNRFRIRKFSAICLLVLVASMMIYNDVYLVGYAEDKGQLSELRRMADSLEGGIVIFEKEESRTWDSGNILGPPLRFLFNCSSYILYDTNLSKKGLDLLKDQILSWKENGKEVYFSSGLLDVAYALSDEFSFQKVGRSKIPFIRIEPTLEIPNKIIKSYLIVDMCRVAKNATMEYYRDLKTYSVVVGENDLGMIKGFYELEIIPNSGIPYGHRWSKSLSFLKVPISGDEDGVEITLHLNAYRPPNVTHPKVSFLIDNSTIYSEVLEGMKEVRIVIPKKCINGSEITIEIRSETFNPKTTMNSSDDRELGFILYDIQVQKFFN